MNTTTYNTYNPNSTLYKTIIEQTIRQNMTTPEQRRQRIYNINYERLQRDTRRIRQNKQIPNNTPTTTRINNILNNTTRDLTDQHEKLLNRQIEQLEKEIQDLQENGEPIIKTPNIKENKEIKKLREKHRKQITRQNKRLEKNKDNRVKWMTERLKDKPRKYKVWNYTPNPKTRHHSNDGQKVPIEEKFIIINDKTGDLDYMDYPGDWSASASNTINCLCGITFTDDPKGAEDYSKFKKLQQEKSTQIKQDNQYKKIAKKYVHDKDYIPEEFSKNAMESIWNFQKKYGEKHEEYGAIYDYKTGKKLIKEDFKGKSGSVRIPFDDITSDTAFSIHNHPPDGYPAPSGQDAYKLIITEKEKRSVIVNNKNIFIVKENKDITKEKVEKIREQLNQIPKEYEETYKEDRLKVDESIEKEFDPKLDLYKLQYGLNGEMKWSTHTRYAKQIKRNQLKDRYDEEHIKRCMNLLLKENIEIHRIIS